MKIVRAFKNFFKDYKYILIFYIRAKVAKNYQDIYWLIDSIEVRVRDGDLVAYLTKLFGIIYADFLAVIYHHKLECLPVSHLLPSLIFAGKTVSQNLQRICIRSLHSSRSCRSCLKIRSDWQCLLQNSNNYCHKKFYSTGPKVNPQYLGKCLVNIGIK